MINIPLLELCSRPFHHLSRTVLQSSIFFAKCLFLLRQTDTVGFHIGNPRGEIMHFVDVFDILRIETN